MKLVVGGSSGFLGTEVVRQALAHPAITSVVALSRRETPVPPSTSPEDARKLISGVCDDFESYPDSVNKALEGAGACIWTIAVTPSKAQDSTWEDIVKITRGYASTAVQTMGSLPRTKDTPFRFMYISGHFAQRSKTDPVPEFVVARGMRDMVLMRGDTELDILDCAQKSGGRMEAAIARPGFIAGGGRPAPPQVPGLPTVTLEDTAAALIDQVLGGFEKETLYSDDLTRIGQKSLQK